VPKPAPLRDEPPLPDDAIVVRGGEMKHRDLERSAATNYDETGEYALTVWSEIGLTAEQIHQKYIPHPKARWSTADRVRGAGYELKPTWDPAHYDIVLPNPPSVTDWDNLTNVFDSLIERPKGA
jgi:hypothetical protein